MRDYDKEPLIIKDYSYDALELISILSIIIAIISVIITKNPASMIFAAFAIRKDRQKFKDAIVIFTQKTIRFSSDEIYKEINIKDVCDVDTSMAFSYEIKQNDPNINTLLYKLNPLFIFIYISIYLISFVTIFKDKPYMPFVILSLILVAMFLPYFLYHKKYDNNVSFLKDVIIIHSRVDEYYKICIFIKYYKDYQAIRQYFLDTKKVIDIDK